MKCWGAHLFDTPCDGRLDPAHIGLTRQLLRRLNYPPSLQWDRRIIRPVCRKHHQRLDGPYFHLDYEQLPESVRQFASEHGLTHILREADRRWHGKH